MASTDTLPDSMTVPFWVLPSPNQLGDQTLVLSDPEANSSSKIKLVGAWRLAGARGTFAPEPAIAAGVGVGAAAAATTGARKVVVVVGATATGAGLGGAPVVVVTGAVVDVVVGASALVRKSDVGEGSAKRVASADDRSVDRFTPRAAVTPAEDAPATTPVVTAKTPTAATTGESRPRDGPLTATGAVLA